MTHPLVAYFQIHPTRSQVAIDALSDPAERSCMRIVRLIRISSKRGMIRMVLN